MADKQASNSTANKVKGELVDVVLPTAEDMKAIRAVKDEDLPWMPPPPDGSGPNRLISKMRENPFVPAGENLCLISVW